MGETLTLGVPEDRAARMRRTLWALLALGILAAAVAVLWWLSSGETVRSRWAALDTAGQIVTAPYPAVIDAVLVAEGAHVTKGQPLLRLGAKLPDPQEMAEQREKRPEDLARERAADRLERAQAAKADVEAQLDEARREEDRASQDRDRAVMELARARLAARALAPGSAGYAAAQQAAMDAQAAADRAEEAFEKANLARAGMERDNMALRDEIARARKIAGPVPPAGQGRGAFPPALQSSDGTLISAEEGLVLHVTASQGQMARMNEQLMEIIPADSSLWWVFAYLPADQAEAVKAGMVCSVLVEGAAEPLEGVVDKIAPASQVEMPDTHQMETVAPVRIRVSGADILARGWKPGTPATCEVRLRTLPLGS